jgi:chromosome partitioning protein
MILPPENTMQMQTIAVFALKGGVGKSALTVFLADFLTSVFEQRVLVIDLDPQQSSTIALLGEERLLTALQNNASIGKTLLDALDRNPKASNVLSYTTKRPMVKPRGRFKYLQEVSVLASDREAWHDLDDRLNLIPVAQQTASWSLLRNALRAVRDEFDICLIDFPASNTGPVVKNGIVAADWWLLPIEPNRMAARDIDGPRRLLRQVSQVVNRKLKGLGTVLSRCQNRGGGEYRRTKAVLTRLASRKIIPKLFTRDAELSYSVEALNALDDTLRESQKTIDQKYGGSAKALHSDIRSLTKEILARLDIPIVEVPDVDMAEDVNAEVTKNYQMV